MYRLNYKTDPLCSIKNIHKKAKTTDEDVGEPLIMRFYPNAIKSKMYAPYRSLLYVFYMQKSVLFFTMPILRVITMFIPSIAIAIRTIFTSIRDLSRGPKSNIL